MKKLFLISGVSALICLGVYAGSNDQSDTTVTIARSCLGNVGENTKVCVKDKDGAVLAKILKQMPRKTAMPRGFKPSLLQ